MKSNYAFLLVFIFSMLVAQLSTAQKIQFETQKTGNFIVKNKLDNYPGADAKVHVAKLNALVEWLRQNNPVLNPPTGFEAYVEMNGNPNSAISGRIDYGAQSFVSISFRYFYIENGVAKTAIDWAAFEAEIYVNNPVFYLGSRFDEAGLTSDDPPRFKQALETARKNLQNYYAVPPLEKEFVPGVRLYSGGGLLVSAPERAEIWIPVTVREIMEAKLAYYKIRQEIDRVNMEASVKELAALNINAEMPEGPGIYDMLLLEYQNFSPEELNSPAFSDSDSGLSAITVVSNGKQVCRFNPDCWDRSLPKTAIQFVTLRYEPQLEASLEEFVQLNSGLTDYVGLFMNSLPINRLGELIEKK
jgi:hypothetical protein